MKKRIWIPIVCAAVLLTVLALPIPGASYDDGGTREWTALTYKIVDWNRLTTEGVYQKTRVYFGADRAKSLDALWTEELALMERSFIATVLSLEGNTVLVQPVAGEEVLSSADRICFAVPDASISAEVGDVVRITYVGGVMETYPAQIQVTSWSISKDLRHMNYPGTWLDKESAERYEGTQSGDYIITEIYADCFFADSVIPLPQRLKINGTLGEKWCVGDQVFVSYNNIYSGENYRMECDMQSIAVSTFEIDPDVAYKPVIYLYPEEETEVSVTLTLNGRLTCTYPAYGDGWTVTAAPNGTLTDGAGQSYNYLYWEGEISADWDMREGFCVRGEDTAAFLETALSSLGLTRREANEFIVFWLPAMQENAYNIISFQTDAYTDAAALAITPQPDTLIRVFMAYRPADCYVEIPPQTLTAPVRTGFTVVEWGGTRVQ